MATTATVLSFAFGGTRGLTSLFARAYELANNFGNILVVKPEEMRKYQEAIVVQSAAAAVEKQVQSAVIIMI
jgi:hypothetical protein